MNRQTIFLLTFFLFTFSLQYTAAKDWNIDVTVAQDGSGDYNTITAAIDANPNNGSNYVIYIKNGVYDEKVFIDKNNITLLGEDRDETIITQAILRRIWRESNDSDWGVATINIDNSATDITLANLTIRNNFADLNPSVPNNTDHTMAIRGGGDKVIIVNCNIIATGGDTISLWSFGRYYHSGCYFEGYVDFVCPRGYCYISNSDFFGFNNNAAIWHDGSEDKDQKFVLKNSYFDGVNFGLGRFHKMSAFYLLDCEFSAQMNSNGIRYVGDSVNKEDNKLYYGIRTYYDRCTRISGNYDWHQNNLATAEGAPTRDDINDKWTFNNTWQPENDIRNLLECAFLPQPGYHAKDVDPKPVLSWLPGKNADSHLVYFGTDSIPEFLATVTDTSYAIATALKSAFKYYWRIDEILPSGDTIKGALWNFYTKISAPPMQVSDPSPPVNDDYNLGSVPLQWKANALEVDSFFIYLGSEDELDLISIQKGTYLRVYNLIEDSVYYWRVDAKNDFGITEGPLWHFNYKISTVSIPESDLIKEHTLRIYPNPASDVVTISMNTLENKKVAIRLYDVNGRKVYQEDLGLLSTAAFIHKIDLKTIGPNANTNLYFVEVAMDEKTATFPLLIQ